MKHSLTFEEWLETKFRLIAGGDGDDDNDTSGDADSDTSSSDADTDASADTTDQSDSDTSGDAGDDDSSSDDNDADQDELDRVRGERDQMRDKLARAESAAQKAKQEARKAREEAAKKHGNWEQVAKERETELADANERAQTAEQRAVTAEDNLDKFQREVRITRIANKLSFRDTQDAIVQLKEKPEATGDDKSCERELRNLAKAKPYLIDERRARGRAMNGSGGGPGMLTKEQMEKMTPEEINAAWENGMVQQSMQNLPGGG